MSSALLWAALVVLALLPVVGGFWSWVAWLVTRDRVFAWLVERGARTPYTNITSADGANVYMYRYWLFNPYSKGTGGDYVRRWEWLPSIRLHRIMRPDLDRDLHDHPWNARTVVLRGFYEEERLYEAGNCVDGSGLRWVDHYDSPREVFHRPQGYTGRLMFGEYHRITVVPKNGVWTLFFTWKFRGDWGYLVFGKKVLHNDYPSHP